MPRSVGQPIGPLLVACSGLFACFPISHCLLTFTYCQTFLDIYFFHQAWVSWATYWPIPGGLLWPIDFLPIAHCLFTFTYCPFPHIFRHLLLPECLDQLGSLLAHHWWPALAYCPIAQQRQEGRKARPSQWRPTEAPKWGYQTQSDVNLPPKCIFPWVNKVFP